MDKIIIDFIEENRHLIEDDRSNLWDVIECSSLKDLFPSKIDIVIFEAFLSGYDSGYDARESNMINDNVGDAVRYVRRNFNEDFEL